MSFKSIGIMRSTSLTHTTFWQTPLRFVEICRDSPEMEGNPYDPFSDLTGNGNWSFNHLVNPLTLPEVVASPYGSLSFAGNGISQQ